MPVATFSSGPVNSLRGAAALCGVRDAVVLDIGGTTTDVGVLVNGLPRPAPRAVKFAGQNFAIDYNQILEEWRAAGDLAVKARPQPLMWGCV